MLSCGNGAIVSLPRIAWLSGWGRLERNGAARRKHDRLEPFETYTIHRIGLFVQKLLCGVLRLIAGQQGTVESNQIWVIVRAVGLDR